MLHKWSFFLALTAIFLSTLSPSLDASEFQQQIPKSKGMLDVAGASLLSLSEFEAELDKVIALEAEATEIQREYVEKVSALAEETAYQKREAFLNPILEEVFSKKKKRKKSFWSFAFTDTQTTQVLDGPSVEPKKGFFSTFKLMSLAGKLKAIENQIDDAYEDLWENSGGLFQDDAMYAQTLLALSYLTTQVRRGVGHPLHSMLFPDDVECKGDLIVDRPLFKYGYHALQALQASNPAIVAKEKVAALAYLSDFIRQLLCIDAWHLAVVDYEYAKEYDATAGTMEEWQIGQAAHDLFLAVLLNPFLILFDENKFHGSEMFYLLQREKERIKQLYQPGTVPYEFGIWFRNPSTGKITLQSFSTSFGGMATDDPLAGIIQQGEIGPELWQDGFGMTPFGILPDQMQEACDIIDLNPEVMQPEKPTWEQAVDNMSDPLRVGHGTQSFVDTAMANVPDTRGSCAGGGGQGGGGDYGKAIACALQEMAKWEMNVQKCTPGLSPLKPQPQASVSGTTGDMAPSKPGSTPSVQEVIFKAADGCGGGSASKDDPTQSDADKDKKEKKDKGTTTGKEKKEKKVSADDKLDKWKKAAKKSWKKFKGKLIKSWENKNGKLSEQQKNDLDKKVGEAIDESDEGIIPQGSDGSSRGGKTKLQGVPDGKGGYKVKAKITWQSGIVQGGGTGNVGKTEGQIQAHEAGHAWMAHADELKGGIEKVKSGMGDHHEHTDNAGFRCGEDGGTCSGACTGAQLQNQVFMKCAPKLPLGGLQQDCTLAGPGCDPLAPFDASGGGVGTGLAGNAPGYTPSGETPYEGGPNCDLGGAAIDLHKIPHFGNYDPSPMQGMPSMMPLGDVNTLDKVRGFESGAMQDSKIDSGVQMKGPAQHYFSPQKPD